LRIAAVQPDSLLGINDIASLILQKKTPRKLSLPGRFVVQRQAVRPECSFDRGLIREEHPDLPTCPGGFSLDHLLSWLPAGSVAKRDNLATMVFLPL
jgi:hypothetical protein